MPKTLDTQGFSGLREEVVRSEGRPSCSSVLQALIYSLYCEIYPRNHLVPGIFYPSSGKKVYVSISCICRILTYSFLF